jgi:hypothetical protein
VGFEAALDSPALRLHRQSMRLQMTLLTLIPLAWAAVATLVVAACQVARQGEVADQGSEVSRTAGLAPAEHSAGERSPALMR